MNLILVKKSSEKEYASAHNRLGLNACQFAREIHQPHIMPFIHGLYAILDHTYFEVDGAIWHQDPTIKKLHEDCGYVHLLWPSNSLNPFEIL